MRRPAFFAMLPLLLPTPLLGVPETYGCRLSDASGGAALTFTMDPAQFAAPVSPDDPPRRQVARVTLDGRLFAAEAILMQDGARGFWDPATGRMLLRAPDADATLTQGARTLTGRCDRVD